MRSAHLLAIALSLLLVATSSQAKIEACPVLERNSVFRQSNICWTIEDERGLVLQCPKANQQRDDANQKFVWEFLQKKLAPLVLGKAVEVVCKEQAPLEKAGAKALGKMAKAVWSDPPNWPALASAGLSGFGAHHLSELISKQNYDPVVLSSLACASVLVDRVSEGEVLFQGQSGLLVDTYELVNEVVMDPVVWKTLRLGTRYALEKDIQTRFSAIITPQQVQGALAALSALFSAHQLRVLSHALPVGISKIASSALLAVTISSIEVGFDQLRDDPQYKTFWEQFERVATDAVVAVSTTTVVAVLLPFSLVLATPTGVLCVFVVGGIYYWVIHRNRLES